MKGWARDLLWFAVIVAAIIAYSFAAGVAWPIAVVSSYSMEPTLKVGDFVILGGANCQSVKPGDIVVYRAVNPLWAGSWIIHRVYQVEGCRLLTWGDNNPAPDQAVGEPPVSSNLIGKVQVIVPYIGVFPLVVRPQGFGPAAIAAWMGRLVIFIAAVYAFYLYFKAAERPRRKQRKTKRPGATEST